MLHTDQKENTKAGNENTVQDQDPSQQIDDPSDVQDQEKVPVHEAETYCTLHQATKETSDASVHQADATPP